MDTSVNNKFVQVTSTGALADSRKVLYLPEADYHGDVHIQSCSMLKPILISPAHYQCALTQTRECTDSMEFGILVHLLTLEPHLVLSKIATYPGVKAARDKDFKAFVASHKGMLIVDEPTMRLAERARDRLMTQRVMGRYFGDFLAEGEPEASIYYTDPTTNVACRTRVDLLHPEGVFDLKTTAYPDTRQWIRHALSLSYDMQAYMYSLAVALFSGRSTALPFIFMSVENALPLSVSARRAGESFLQEGAMKYQKAIGAFAACSKVDYWPSPGGEEVIEIEHWQANQTSRLSNFDGTP
jgi:hypothetical protein